MSQNDLKTSVQVRQRICRRLGKMGFSANPAVFRIRYLRHVCTEGPVLNKWISDSFKNLAISTYRIKSYWTDGYVKV